MPNLALVGGAVAVGIGALALLTGGTAGASSSAAKGEIGPVGPDATTTKAELDAILVHAGLSRQWRTFFLWVAHGESRFDSLVENTARHEANGAKRAWRRNEPKLEKCGFPADGYTYGSGGLYGAIPANFAAQLLPRCVSPFTVVHNPSVSTAAAAAFARGLMTWDRYKSVPTFLNLRVGWGWPAHMGKVESLDAAIDKAARHLAAIGASAAFMDKSPAGPPPRPAKILRRLTST